MMKLIIFSLMLINNISEILLIYSVMTSFLKKVKMTPSYIYAKRFQYLEKKNTIIITRKEHLQRLYFLYKINYIKSIL